MFALQDLGGTSDILTHDRQTEEPVHMAEVERLVKDVQTVISPSITYVIGPSRVDGGSRTDPQTEE